MKTIHPHQSQMVANAINKENQALQINYAPLTPMLPYCTVQMISPIKRGTSL